MCDTSSKKTVAARVTQPLHLHVHYFPLSAPPAETGELCRAGNCSVKSADGTKEQVLLLYSLCFDRPPRYIANFASKNGAPGTFVLDITSLSNVLTLRSDIPQLVSVFGGDSPRDQRVMTAGFDLGATLPEGWTLYVIYDHWYKWLVNHGLNGTTTPCELPGSHKKSSACTLSQVVAAAGGTWSGSVVSWSDVPQQGSQGQQLRYSLK